MEVLLQIISTLLILIHMFAYRERFLVKILGLGPIASVSVLKKGDIYHINTLKKLKIPEGIPKR